MRPQLLITVFLILNFYIPFCLAFNVLGYENVRQWGPQSTEYLGLRIYIHGMKDGLEWMNAFLEEKGQQKLFCPPEKEHFNTAYYIGVINDAIEVRRQFYVDINSSVGEILLNELQIKYPCHPGK